MSQWMILIDFVEKWYWYKLSPMNLDMSTSATMEFSENINSRIANSVDVDGTACCCLRKYRIRPNYRTVHLGSSKLLGTLSCDKI